MSTPRCPHPTSLKLLCVSMSYHSPPFIPSTPHPPSLSLSTSAFAVRISISFFPSLSFLFFEKPGVPAPHQDAGCRVPSTKWQHHLIQVAQLLGESSLTPKRLQAQFQVRSYTYAVGSIASWGTNGRQTDHSFFLSLPAFLKSIKKCIRMRI